jgi:hypothetical protein
MFNRAVISNLAALLHKIHMNMVGKDTEEVRTTEPPKMEINGEDEEIGDMIESDFDACSTR